MKRSKVTDYAALIKYKKVKSTRVLLKRNVPFTYTWHCSQKLFLKFWVFPFLIILFDTQNLIANPQGNQFVYYATFEARWT